MENRFKVIFLDDAIDFMDELDEKVRNKIIYNIDKVKVKNDPEIFKKLNEFI